MPLSAPDRMAVEAYGYLQAAQTIVETPESSAQLRASVLYLVGRGFELSMVQGVTEAGGEVPAEGAGLIDVWKDAALDVYRETCRENCVDAWEAAARSDPLDDDFTENPWFVFQDHIMKLDDIYGAGKETALTQRMEDHMTGPMPFLVLDTMLKTTRDRLGALPDRAGSA
ncbi:hypothetical protein [uncultured Roseobacter sp.]|uniref:hypothetical protein n=1 Tax=uncultured Roseobacter sp. TaxID=114847 RepID=UPI00260DDF9D|nr:hypothetical protein [uncultured Roseobacter sp.]